MKKIIRAAAAGALLCASLPAAAVAQGGAALVQLCWTPSQLAGRPEEKPARWTRQDAPMPAIDARQMAPVSTHGTVRRVKLPPGRKLVALTFDLCEAAMEVAGYDGAVVDYLRANRVKATFFAGGKWMISHPERSSQLLAGPLFEIGTHGWAHVNLHVAQGQAVTNEILGSLAAYGIARERLAANACVRAERSGLSRIPQRPRLFRFPFGTCHAEALDAVAQAGLIAIQWDVVTGDPARSVSASGIARAVLDAAKPGSIIVAHANGRGWQTAAALPLFIPEMRRRGFEFVTVSELLAAGTPEIAPTCYERRPGDNLRYDLVQSRRNRASGGQQGTPPTWPKVLDGPR